MDTKRLYELARDVEHAKNNLDGEKTKYDRAKNEHEKAKGILAQREQRLIEFLAELGVE